MEVEEHGALRIQLRSKGNLDILIDRACAICVPRRMEEELDYLQTHLEILRKRPG